MSTDLLEPGQGVELVERLLSLTERGLLRWDEESEYQFETAVRNSQFKIRSIDDDDQHPFAFLAAHDGGAVQLKTEIEDGVVAATPLNDRLAKLYAAAKRSATGIDALLEGMWSDLASLEEDDVPF